MAARDRLYKAAIELMTERGYAETTLRDVAARTGTSAALLYRYFPSKQAVVLQLYDQLSAEFRTRASPMPRGRWRHRFLFALKTSLEVLGPHRKILSALIPVLVGDPHDGLFATGTAFSRRRVLAVFSDVVTGAIDAPSREIANALGRLLYLVQLAVILWWLLDRSRGQRATRGLVDLTERASARVALTLRLPFVRSLVLAGDDLIRQALFGET